ncbi:MAG: sulfatase-like hydrolase/transferase [Myxococcota bacterium]
MQPLSRRTFLGAMGAGATSLLLPGCGAPARRPPNFLVVMADDLGASNLSCYGGTRIETPNLDQLAAGGMRFETCWSTPLCTPTRIELMTGQYAGRTGWFNYFGRAYAPLPESSLYPIGAKRTFADVLRTRGYRTAVAGKWQLPGGEPDAIPPGEEDAREQRMVYDAGFDEYLVWAWFHPIPGGRHTGRFEVPNLPARYWHPGILRNGEYVPTQRTDYGPDLFADFIVDFMRRHRDLPFLAYYPMVLTHAPWEPPPDRKHPTGRGNAGFEANVAYMDRIVGRLLSALSDLKLREDTVVLFTGDNAARYSKGRTTELGVRVPLIASGPGYVKPGTTSDALVDLSDVFPTLVSLAGASIPDGHRVDGSPLDRTLRGDVGDHREWIHSYLADKRLLRDRRWLREGDGRLFDCGDERSGTGYEDVTQSTGSDVADARDRFDAILAAIPGPEDLAGELILPSDLAPGGRFHGHSLFGNSKACT